LPDRIGAAVIAAVTLSMAVLVAAPAPTAAAAPKVAIIVGPVGTLTNTYRSMANEVATAATAAGATVAKAYSPSATWANVRTAVSGANVIVYFGHGNGFPNPYSSTENPDRVNGWGLNRTTTNGDSDNWSTTMVYCGEKALLGTLASTDGVHQWNYCGGKTNTDRIAPAPGFTMVYAQAHYAPGFGERYVESDPIPTQSQAQQRVRNYSYPVLKLGAGAFFATAYGDADDIVSRVLSQPTRSFGATFKLGRGYSSSALRTMAHPDIAGGQVWVQKTVAGSMHFGDPDYWYAFAGDPNRTPGGTPAGGPAIERLAGSDRYATAAAVSAASFAPGTPVAYVATGATFPDALAAGAAAAHLDGPVLLVASNTVPAATAAELSRLRPGRIEVVGGTAVISNGVIDALRAYATSGTVARIAGANRFATAARVSADTFAPGVSVAYVATGEMFPDALSGVAAAGTNGAPILLVGADHIPAETAAELDRLDPGRIVVLGGAGVVSDAVAAGLSGHATSGSVTRLAGADRYATAVAVSRGTFASGTTVFVATGMTFPDALGGGPVAGGLPGPLLLVPGTYVPASVAGELQRLDPDTVVVLGGTSAVSNAVTSQISSLLAD
jgi:putative cell wall-binding protein